MIFIHSCEERIYLNAYVYYKKLFTTMRINDFSIFLPLTYYLNDAVTVIHIHTQKLCRHKKTFSFPFAYFLYIYIPRRVQYLYMDNDTFFFQ